MSFGIDVASNANTSDTAIKDLLFTSRVISLKNVIYGSGSIMPHWSGSDDLGGYIATVVVPHNLGYAPVHFLYFRPANGNNADISMAPWIADTNDPTVWSFIDKFQCTTEVDEKKLTILFQRGQVGIPFDYRYFILVEEAS